ncbi:hypothetical protein BGI40_10645 [Snodgrassella communis]|uniref:Uncharacterized protein n=1 Tax=Snodgrassella communis TaxID=2946699 RepID=A0A836Z3R5_9NEIS|nr:hypothetical protein [Snodgrassella communis]KDN15565.1 hypothetical protein SALWKB29_0669 [Snodgrassella communis]PIT07229.1 hypothetical protein BGI29_10045 [Snodgrassella communis]PIT26028.1 hypothetical protein BGI38_09460 [Snodgrassella communis]PIT27634.1 hypothetical protein BGI39_07545 [Snodgrassella communis]PIT31374.1 hypothetical protein BGI40_10645 [Snodgrassella communis]
MMPAGLITASCLNINPHIFKINKGEKQCIYKLDGFYFDRKRKGWLDFFRRMEKVYLPRLEKPTVNEMQQYLEVLRTNNGFLSLWKQSKSKPISPGMQITLYSDNHETDIQTYMVLLGEKTEEDY